MDLCYAGKQEHNCYNIGRKSGGVRGQNFSAGKCVSPLQWSLFVDDILWGLNNDGQYTVGYADDITILIN
jgi:hypothetical protein